MDLTFFGLEPVTSARILVTGVATVTMLVLITIVARRWHSYWWTSIALIVASCGGLALGGYFAVRILQISFDGMRTSGGGIASVRLAIWQATQPVLAAAWLAMLVTLFASVFAFLVARKERISATGSRGTATAKFALLAVIALVSGATPVVLYRRAIKFVLWSITPRAETWSKPNTIAHDVAAHLFRAAAASACCFVLVVMLLAVTIWLSRRSSPSRTYFAVTVIALVASFGLSCGLVVSLHSLSSRSHEAALNGGMFSE